MLLFNKLFIESLQGKGFVLFIVVPFDNLGVQESCRVAAVAAVVTYCILIAAWCVFLLYVWFICYGWFSG
ncbi:hypothetical protein BDB00DRAFT_816678 [Zychaea mexicana]|uniref:uncharacterized protein n=1 Tax=Zychaea mexicana TaxID=64656 RepID=UPI0022FDB636|nr:uncharacterized protein BDB00DRAFT_839956 [Zychaea mexicana]XP_052981267.1 uncharacterized protein BDB00DRAFT_816678 [Zychaea mexicana]KAI9490046.1 hypothetical protein BDB00DRAFT_839956 [Zychaea mexicana]KAI9495002.1 hypothetical protein BDB00DRAFT_816678 [Zychaea mexicana]